MNWLVQQFNCWIPTMQIRSMQMSNELGTCYSQNSLNCDRVKPPRTSAHLNINKTSFRNAKDGCQIMQMNSWNRGRSADRTGGWNNDAAHKVMKWISNESIIWKRYKINGQLKSSQVDGEMVQCDYSGARVSTPDTRVQPTDPAPSATDLRNGIPKLTHFHYARIKINTRR